MSCLTVAWCTLLIVLTGMFTCLKITVLVKKTFVLGVPSFNLVHSKEISSLTPESFVQPEMGRTQSYSLENLFRPKRSNTQVNINMKVKRDL